MRHSLKGIAIAIALGLGLILGGTLEAGAVETLKLSLSYEPGTPHHKWATWIADEVKKRTDGRYEIEVFPSGQLGSERDVEEALALGAIAERLQKGSNIPSGICRCERIDRSENPEGDNRCHPKRRTRKVRKSPTKASRRVPGQRHLRPPAR